MQTRTALITHPNSVLHEMGAYHPESPQRIIAILDFLKEHGLIDLMLQIEATPAPSEALVKVHSDSYVDYIFSKAPSAKNAIFNIDPDTTMNRHTLKAALTASGAVLDAVDGIMNNKFDNAFCCIRPPGHHAEKATGMGFCFFNNIAVGAQHVLDKYALERVAIVDFDVHHGNGTEDIFLAEPRVLFCSTFQEYIFPGKAANSQPGHIVNVPLVAGCNSNMYRKAFSEEVLPELEKFKPEFIFISAGFDAHKDDQLAGLKLETQDYSWITEQISKIANKYAKGRMVSVLEGGYNLDALAQSVGAHVNALLRKF